MHVGQRVRALLAEKDISITAAAEAIGKTRQTMYDLCDKPNISTDVLLRLSSKFLIPIEAFFANVPVSNSNPATASVAVPPMDSKELGQWLQDRQKIITLQEEHLKWERGRQAFGLFLQKLWENIAVQREIRWTFNGKEQKGSIYSGMYEVSAENAQEAYNEVFELYYDFGFFFETGFITNPSWKEAWERYKDGKMQEEQQRQAEKKQQP